MSTFSDLRTRIQNFFGVSDTEATTVINDSINDILQDINAEVPQSEALQASTTFTLTVGATQIPSFPPSNLGRVLDIFVDDTDGNRRRPLEFITRKTWNEQRYFDLGNSIPAYYTIWDSNFHVAPKPNSAYTGGADYFKFDTALSGSTDTRSLTDTYSRWERVLIQGVKSKMYEFFQDDQSMIDLSFKKYQFELSRFRAWSRRNFDQSMDASRIRNWKELTPAIRNLVPFVIRRF